jgi:hypothetical protein
MKQNIILFLCILYSASLLAQEPLYRMSTDKPRWATFENPKATVGARVTLLNPSKQEKSKPCSM